MIKTMLRALREMSGASLALASFGVMAWSVTELGRHAWLEGALSSLFALLALGAATELLRESVGE